MHRVKSVGMAMLGALALVVLLLTTAQNRARAGSQRVAAPPRWLSQAVRSVNLHVWNPFIRIL